MPEFFARKTIPLALVATLVALLLLVSASCSNTPKPVAAFNGECTDGVLYETSPITGLAPLTVKFYDRSTGKITEWRWNFGDGGKSTQQAPSHTYTSDGKYTVTLTVEGPGGFDTEYKTQFVYIFTISEAANRELFAVRNAISECMAAAVAQKLDAQAIAWDGLPGIVTAGGGTVDAADYLPPEPLRATYDIYQDGTVYNGTDVSWTGIYWDATPGVDRWRGVGD